ncbi:MAG TPA: sialidase family protein [Candidatus Hydrogenedentes bacterium]|nr:sialidase family protein [Candidatus Hydrogenedentota bacterium]HNT87171.1 sialidase family protein [Candidatus Hydrogenedentota bacterium]
MTAMTCVLTVAAAIAQSLHETELIFPFDPLHNHSSCIVETPEGGLLVVWFHGSGERSSDDVVLQGARRKPGATAWSASFLMADTPDLPDCNPVLFVDPRGTLWLLWVTILNNEWGSALLKYRVATDYEGDGPPRWDWQDVIHCRPVKIEEQFSALIEKAEEQLGPFLDAVDWMRSELDAMRKAPHDKLTRRLGWMTRVHPIMLSDTRMMLGLYSDVFNCSMAAFTEDWGKTWTFSEPILDPLVKHLANIQPSFVRRSDGAIVAYMRDNGIPKYVRTAVSTDGGLTWGEYGWTDIRNPGSSVECIALRSGRWLLVCNDTVEGRYRLSVFLSEDEGKTWPHSRALEDFPPSSGGSASYPSMIQAADGTVHCTYSYKEGGVPGSTIKHVRFNEAWILEGDTP